MDASSSPVDAFSNRLGVDAAGRSTAAWQTGDGFVEVVTRAPGAAAFGMPQLFAPDDVFSLTSPALAVAGDGTAALAFVDPGFDGSHVMVATRASAQGPFSDPVDLSVGLEGGGDSELPVVVVAPSGAVTAAWVQITDQFAIVARTRPAGSTTWDDPVTVASSPSRLRVPRAVIDELGNVTLAWTDALDIRLATRKPGEDFSVPQNLTPSSSDNASHLSIAADDSGITAVEWASRTGSTSVGRLTIRRPGQDFSAAIELTPTSTFVEAPQVLIAPDGDVTAAWIRWPSSSEDVVETATAHADGSVTAPSTPLASSQDQRILRDLVGTTGPDGAVTLAWNDGGRVEDTDDNAFQEYAAHRAVGAGFGDPVVLDDSTALTTSSTMAIAADGDGDITTIYTVFDGDRPVDPGHFPRSSVLDVRGPVLSWTGATAGTAGAPVALGVSAHDTWSEPSTVAWDFGDGSQGSGLSPTHSYAAAGTYAVHVTATDGVGNTTALTRQVSIVPAAPSDATPPVLRGAKLRPALLPTAGGAILRVRSSEAAQLVATVQRKRQQGGWRTVGTKHWVVAQGVNKLHFYGRIAERRLPTAVYRARLVGTDPAGNISVPATFRFRVDRG